VWSFTSSWVLSLLVRGTFLYWLVHATNWSTNWSKSRTWSKAGVCTVSVLTSFSCASAVALSASFLFSFHFFFIFSICLCVPLLLLRYRVFLLFFFSVALSLFFPTGFSFVFLSSCLALSHARMDCLSPPPTPPRLPPPLPYLRTVFVTSSFSREFARPPYLTPLLPHSPLSSLFSGV
jgi:hypothetical protein